MCFGVALYLSRGLRFVAYALGGLMKIVQVVPSSGIKRSLKQLIKEKERSLRGKGTTFVRDGEGRWTHETYPGWINWEETHGGVVVAELRTKKDGAEWQLTQAFVGYLNRHFGEHIDSISIVNR
jgi:hypothetical protein